MTGKLTDLWIALIISIAVFLLFDLVAKLAGFKDQRAKDTAFVLFLLWIGVSSAVLIVGSL